MPFGFDGGLVSTCAGNSWQWLNPFALSAGAASSMPLILFCTAWACRVTRDKVTVAHIRANEHNAHGSQVFDTARSRP